MAAAVEKLYPVAAFFRNRYFETVDDQDIFATQQVLAEFKKGGRTLAPFVVPRVGGIPVEREGYHAHLITPPYIAPFKPLHIDELNEKGFGENLFTQKTPEERERELLAEDMLDLTEQIDRREEWMCTELLTKGEVVMLHYAEKYGTGDYKEKILRFYEETFDNEYVPVKSWTDTTADIYGDLSAMVSILTTRGCAAVDLIFGAQAYDSFIKNPEIQKLFDNRSINVGEITGIEVPDGVQSIGRFVVRGKALNIFVYEEQYKDIDGKIKPFLPTNTVIITAPNIAKMQYGAITQIEQNDYMPHTYAMRKVPHYYADAKTGVREIRVASAPVPVPKDTEAWVVSKVIK